MGMFDSQQRAFGAVHGYMQSLFPPEDPMVGAFLGNQSKTFSNQMYAVAVSTHLMAIQPLDRKMQPSAPVTWLRAVDITAAAIWGEGGGFREWMAQNSEFELRFTTAAGEKYKILALGGWTMSKMMGEQYILGLQAVADWLARARH
ncbi:MAG: hypothetical protein Q8M22_06115 [Actinomycetota bacterium]|nr:hypothetical protein [Actinomycetota bacterium]